MTNPLISADWKNDEYNSILVIIDQLTKMLYYVLVKAIINVLDLVEVIINMVVYQHGVFESIVIS